MRTRWNAEEGFTLVEVLAGLAAISMLAVGVWGAAAAAFRGSERARGGHLASAGDKLDGWVRSCIGGATAMVGRTAQVRWARVADGDLDREAGKRSSSGGRTAC
jgi:prepilin-type N-terminal cleavage/methylation domain-containing protein